MSKLNSDGSKLLGICKELLIYKTPDETTLGLCSHVISCRENYAGRNILNVCLLLEALYKQWPMYSGSMDYPVPHPTRSAAQGYIWEDNLWDESTTYGRNRWALVQYIVDTLEAKEVA